MKVRVSDAQAGDENLLGEYVVDMPDDLFHSYARARQEHARLAEEVAKLCRASLRQTHTD